jgi:hypothetical protein
MTSRFISGPRERIEACRSTCHREALPDFAPNEAGNAEQPSTIVRHGRLEGNPKGSADCGLKHAEDTARQAAAKTLSIGLHSYFPSRGSGCHWLASEKSRTWIWGGTSKPVKNQKHGSGSALASQWHPAFTHASPAEQGV